jgi:hypothetical protein
MIFARAFLSPIADRLAVVRILEVDQLLSDGHVRVTCTTSGPPQAAMDNAVRRAAAIAILAI